MNILLEIEKQIVLQHNPLQNKIKEYTMEVSIASYNTSWLGDQGLPNGFASEKHLFAELFKDKSKDPRQYFINAIDNALHFWQNVETAGAIGFQEMNQRSYVATTINGFTGGTDYITDRFSNISDDVALEECFINVGPGINPGLLTIWKPSIFGNLKHKYYDDLTYTPDIGKVPVQKGRPIMIVITDKNYVLINLHGPNFPALDENLNELRKAINEHLDKALKAAFNVENVLKKLYIHSSKIFIMGDFNDAYNRINPTNPLIINGSNYCYGNQGDPPVKSCCYNFNSSCPKNLLSKNVSKDLKVTEFPREPGIDTYTESEDKLILPENECAIIDSTNPDKRQGPGVAKITARSLGDRGNLENYQFTGDYVLGLMDNISQPLQIYRSVKRLVSEESDHEMVYATFKLPDLRDIIQSRRNQDTPKGTSFGGKSRKKYKTKKYKKRKSRKYKK